jgi:hypothetical protein
LHRLPVARQIHLDGLVGGDLGDAEVQSQALATIFSRRAALTAAAAAALTEPALHRAAATVGVVGLCVGAFAVAQRLARGAFAVAAVADLTAHTSSAAAATVLRVALCVDAAVSAQRLARRAFAGALITDLTTDAGVTAAAAVLRVTLGVHASLLRAGARHRVVRHSERHAPAQLGTGGTFAAAGVTALRGEAALVAISAVLRVGQRVDAGVAAGAQRARTLASACLTRTLPRTGPIAAAAVLAVAARVDAVATALGEAFRTALRCRFALAAITDRVGVAGDVTGAAVFRARREPDAHIAAGDRVVQAAHSIDRTACHLRLVLRFATGQGHDPEPEEQSAGPGIAAPPCAEGAAGSRG